MATVPFFLVTQLKTQAKVLQESGAEIVMVSSAGPEIEGIKAAEIPHVIIDIPRIISPWRDVMALWNLYKFFRKQRFDIVHSTTPKAGLLTSLAALVAGVPVRLHTFTGQQWVSMVGLTRFVSRLADRLIGLINTRCYADSKSQRQFLVDEGLVAPDRIKVIGQGSLAGVDLDRFDPGRWPKEEKKQIKEKLGISQTATVLIFIGRIAREKGIHELLDAFMTLVGDGADVDLLLIGPLDRDCGGSDLITSEDLSRIKRLHYLGYSSMPEKYLAIADIFCLPSYREGFGTVVIEAAAMGVPTLGSKINGLIDAVEDGKTGVLIPAKNKQALYDALRTLLDDPFQLELLGKASRTRCAKLFDSSVVGAFLVAEYRELLF